MSCTALSAEGIERQILTLRGHRVMLDAHLAVLYGVDMTHAVAKGVKAHRDIKPQNCLVTEDFILKVTDFGLAKVVLDGGAAPLGSPVKEIGGVWKRLAGHGSEQRPAEGLSQTGASAGTPAYMAPEQFSDFKHVDLRADVYSFGVMLFQMVTGQLPFATSSSLEFERLHRLQQPATRLVRNREISHLIEKCLSKKAYDRYQDFSEIRELLAITYVSITQLKPPTRGFRERARRFL
jgi:serine/threonine-protein kinase